MKTRTSVMNSLRQLTRPMTPRTAMIQLGGSGWLLAALILWVGLGAAGQAPAATGTVVAWGNNNYGQTTVPSMALTGVTAITAGDGHSVALKSDGTVMAWGASFAGQTSVPVGLSGVTAVAAGWYHTLALKGDGTLSAWGQVYDGINYVPVTVPAGLSGVTALGGGFGHSAVLKGDGTVAVWGWNGYGQTNVPAGLTDIAAIAVGGSHTIALRSNGTVVAWGRNYQGQVTGTPTTELPYWAVANPVTLGGQVLSGVTAVAAGEEFSVALKSDGSVVLWGYSLQGQLPVPVEAQSSVTMVSAGNHILALKSAGTVVSWGRNDQGQTVVPAGLSGVAGVAAGRLHSLALVVPAAPVLITQPVSQTASVGQGVSLSVTATGTLPLTYQWRRDGTNLVGVTNATYSLGAAQTNLAGSYSVVVSNSVGSLTSAPPAILTVNPVTPGAVVAWGNDVGGGTNVPAGLNSVIALAASGSGEHTLALKSDGTVVAFGLNSSGQINVPAGLSGVTGVAVGYYHSLALKGDGTVAGWGMNGDGQATIPAGLNDVRQISAGGYFSLALKQDGTVVAWGQNTYGQTSVPVAAQSKVVAVAAGSYHGAALKQDGTVVVWGYGGNGETSVPAGLGGVVAIACGWHHVLALKSDGTVVAWGYNTVGQTVVPAGLSGVKAVAGGFGHSAALKHDGTVVVWGANNVGQRNVPPTVVGAVVLSAAGSHTAVVVGSPPIVTLQPVGQVFALGGGVTFSVGASGTGLSYQWQLNGVNLPGATGSSLSLTGLSATNAGNYRVVVTGANGAVVTSQTAALLFFGDPKFYAGTTLAGPVGQQFRVDYADVVVPGTTNWLLLTNLTLPASPYLLIDLNSPGKPQRYYRAVPSP